jgi:flavin-dependent dehydrogenase
MNSSGQSESSSSSALSSEWDVVVIGGALAGSATALRLLRRQPHLRVLIVEKSSVFTRRVGESTVEISAYYLGRVLGLTHYLNENHLVKQGLRFWFRNDRTRTLACCSETGGGYNVRFPGYQVDRSTLDEEVLSRAREAGATVLRPARVTSFELESGGTQTVTVQTERGEQVLRARWLVDASGFTALIARKKGWIRPNTEHPIASVWARFKGVQDWDGLPLAKRHPAWARRVVATRHTATNHLVGQGYWIWCIPLKGGDVSLGVVYDQRLMEFPAEGPLGERLAAFIKSHPAGAELLESATWNEGDVHARKSFAYHSTTFAGDGFVLVGDAGAFMDPFYSPGMDWVSFSTSSAVDLLDRAFTGEDPAPLVASMNERFPRSYQRWFEAIYKDKYFYMGDWELMTLAFRLDLGLYYLGVVSQPFRDGEAGLLEPPFVTPLSKWPFRLIRLYNQRLAAMGRNRMERGVWGRYNDRHVYKFNSYTFGHVLSLRVLRALADWGWLEVREGWRSWFSSPAPSRSTARERTPAIASAPK